MGLEKFIDGLEDNTEEDTTHGNESQEDDLKYRGNKELLDLSLDELDKVLESTELEFVECNVVIKGHNRASHSNSGGYVLVVSFPKDHHEHDCIRVHVLESESMYDVIEPYKVFMVKGWEANLKKAIQSVIDKSDNIVYCPRCEEVMIIRTTNSTGDTIRGCSNYPDCRYRERIQ